MRDGRFRGLTIRTALILGFGLMVGLWLFTGYQFTQGLADAERKSAEVASQYVRAQEALASLRPQVLAASGIVRDALMDRAPHTLATSRADLDLRLATIHATVDQYLAPVGGADERERLQRLSVEAGHFASVLRQTLDEADEPSVNGRAVFARQVLPLRSELLRVTEDLQAVNRAAFLQYQDRRAAEHGAAERQAAEHLVVALLFSVAIAVMATLSSGRLEKRLRSQLQQDAMKTRALQDLSIKMIRVQEDERRRIARELHDEVGQALTAIKVEISLAERAITPGDGSASPLRGAQAITDGALQTVRDLSRLLHPAILDDLGLPDAVDGYVREFARRFDIKAELLVEGLEARLAPDIEVAAYRMIQEALTNVAKHARASRCQVTLRRRDDRFEAIIRDDGTGFRVAELDRPDSRRGLGLIGMRERALQLAGVVSLESGPGQGTALRITLPARVGSTDHANPPAVGLPMTALEVS
jgi:signal transduction histidine kinase